MEKVASSTLAGPISKGCARYTPQSSGIYDATNFGVKCNPKTKVWLGPLPFLAAVNYLLYYCRKLAHLLFFLERPLLQLL